jgi:hypothetical protein
MRIENIDRIVLCRKGKSCCPEINRVDDGFEIVDDYDGKVKLTSDELSMLKDAITHFEDADDTIPSYEQCVNDDCCFDGESDVCPDCDCPSPKL